MYGLMLIINIERFVSFLFIKLFRVTYNGTRQNVDYIRISIK